MRASWILPGRPFSAGQRPFACVPTWVLVCLVAALFAQWSVKSWHSPESPAGTELAPPPGMTALRLASLGDPIPLAKLLTLHLQSFDHRAGNPLPYQSLDYRRLAGWLEQLLRLDPVGQYPLMLASRVYAEVPIEPKQRLMMELVYAEFLKDPGRRWPWLAHVAVIAKHRLKDLALARRYAAAIQQHATGEDVPLWARQMEAFILEDMNELEAARLMIGGFIEKGMIKDEGELRFLEQRLQELERKAAVAK